MTAISTLPQTFQDTDQDVVAVARAAGFQVHGGWIYPPGETDKALVRISVFDGRYQIWRRRKPTSEWMAIVEESTDDFDKMAFSAWQHSYPMSA